ncbi:hypothetical protein ETB97_000841 [Aspergillus alliaceus]|uniref:T6SS Phospholipase effector Tle1-like catalytic domain-containing protein n=1 Tax=Petromyces alliaceus TaxID=209559 RepID=A0A8H6A7Z4_PETAA|nr:hypothetical protein ETB97_000841 [Aspergillus burnettii]
MSESDTKGLPWSNRKRLIVCCDGTWNSSIQDSFQPPTNVTRLSRAISREGVTDEGGVKKRISQIVYYQQGVGTGALLGDKLGGGAIGIGVSAHVREAYGFLTDNYDDGDEIFFFGFSRGAYTARAVAGLVTNLGLLTPRGMDNFTTIYNAYYHRANSAQEHDYQDQHWRDSVGFRQRLPRFTIKIIGVWDTVAFHNSWISRMLGEQLELPDTILSPDVQHAFQALSLDETRNTYKPVLWHLLKKHDGQELLQVWFSGYHSDVGGGAKNPRLSDITLAWMVGQCTKDNQLSIDMDYFHASRSSPSAVTAEHTPWATGLGVANPVKWGIARLLESFRGCSARTPLGYSDNSGGWNDTHERIHESIRDRNISSSSRDGYWPSKVLTGQRGVLGWSLVGGRYIGQFDASRVERELKGRIRKVHPTEWDLD